MIKLEDCVMSALKMLMLGFPITLDEICYAMDKNNQLMIFDSKTKKWKEKNISLKKFIDLIKHTKNATVILSCSRHKPKNKIFRKSTKFKSI